MIKDLVHADPLPAEQQNGQLTAEPAGKLSAGAILLCGVLEAADDATIKRLAKKLLAGHRAALASPNDEGKGSPETRRSEVDSAAK